MRPPDQVLRELVEQWIAKAEVDYRAAEWLLQGGEPIREAVAFHCQQTVEKYLKALLVRHQIEFPKTHNLRQLLDMAARVAPEMAESLQDIVILTPYGVDIRYPSDFPDVLPGQEVVFCQIAARVRDQVVGQLGSYRLKG